MNAYVSFSLAMCAIVFVSLAGTSYLAMYFNRKAKEDLKAALTPLAEVLDGTLDIDEATVSGRYRGHITSAKVSTLPGGMGRVFLISLVDGSGGEHWQWTLSRSKEPGGAPAGVFDSEPSDFAGVASATLDALTTDPALIEAWFRLEYDPSSGHVQLTKPMRNRRDIPGPETFTRLLDSVYAIADANRRAQGPQITG